MGNNKKLFQQLRGKLLEEYGSQIRDKRETSLKFFVRDRSLQKGIQQDKIVYRKQELVMSPSGEGMGDELIEVFFQLLENALKNYVSIEYGHIYITYKIDDSVGSCHRY
jgi:hypothetical protein